MAARTPVNLFELATQIREAHAASTSVDRAVRCGQLLTEAKSQLAHGEWVPWLTQDCGRVVRTAQAHMKLARKWDAASEGIRNVWRIQGVRVTLYGGDSAQSRRPAADPVERCLEQLRHAAGKIEGTAEVGALVADLRALADDLEIY